MADPSSLMLPHLAPSGDSAFPLSESQPPPMDFTDAQVDEYREQDRFLPIANVARIMKSSLPPSAKVSKEAKECVQECVSEFISFITSEAADKCVNEKRKTIGGEDILTSMQALGFDNYSGVMKVYLAKFRVHQSAQVRKGHEDPSLQDGEDEEDTGLTATGRKKRRRTGESNAKKRKKGAEAMLH